MTSTGMRLLRPAPVELVSVDEVGKIVAEIDLRITTLERKAADSIATAEELERRAEAEGVDERASTWAIVRLQRFIDSLRAEAEHDAETIIAAARKGARARIEEARVGAARVRHEAIAIPDSPSVVPSAAISERAVDAPVAAEPRAADVLEVTPEPTATPSPTPVARREPLVAVTPEPMVDVSELAPQDDDVDAAVRWAPIGIPVQPATNGNGAGTPAISGPSPAPAVTATVLAPAAVPNAPAAIAPEPAPTPAVAPPSTPVVSALPAPRRKRFLRGFPISAVLEVLAVLLVLLFILLRLS